PEAPRDEDVPPPADYPPPPPDYAPGPPEYVPGPVDAPEDEGGSYDDAAAYEDEEIEGGGVSSQELLARELGATVIEETPRH
ncbi:hypothetical protein LZ495_18345, partial [Yinghuangia sp. KLBMP8922]|nr:hypothetical protein [Yinghuangia soli]